MSRAVYVGSPGKRRPPFAPEVGEEGDLYESFAYRFQAKPVKHEYVFIRSDGSVCYVHQEEVRRMDRQTPKEWPAKRRLW